MHGVRSGLVELGRELSMERTVQRYLDVAEEALAARPPSGPIG